MNLEFLYYQRKLILDGFDPKEFELGNLRITFNEFMQSASLSDVIKVIINAYKEQYAQHKFFAVCFYDEDTNWESPKYPDNLGLRTNDFYLQKNRMTRTDIEYLILRILKDDYTKTNARYLEELELVFAKPMYNLETTIRESLIGMEFTEESTMNVKIFTVNDSPIDEIKISNEKFILKINRDKWKAYY
ncbi:hypothetical protein C8N46_106287 [Kordia periserrulae]|uniref:Uncharacterized protein n=1 Tax=Kordia periserrulae TaxID=701523 RepID=A0A2T6BX38_9FLAO|nr:hypothetical protein [Kordia periserrulae]PTX60641.1 hypothetical protein C8N46_106287 [Kordia periserrulae]